IKIKKMFENKIIKGSLLVALAVLIFTACQTTGENKEDGYIAIREQGSFAIGGTVITAPGKFDPIAHGAFNPGNQSSEGQTLHGDHAFVIYQKPVDARKLPLVFWHG